MSVDYYVCNNCEETFCDVGYFVSCKCGRRWCDDECASEDGYLEDYCKSGKCEEGCVDNCNECDDFLETSCDYCRNEKFEDFDMLNYALKLLGKSKEELVLEMRKGK